MRRSSDSSQFHDETPSRRRVRRASSQDDRLGRTCETKNRGPDMVDKIPTSPYKQGAQPFMISPSGTTTSSHVIPPLSPHRGGNFSSLAHGQSTRTHGELSPRSPYPHQSVISPSRYQSAPPVYTSPTPSPSSSLATPSCSSSSNPSSTFSRDGGGGLKSPEFFGAAVNEVGQLSPAKTLGESSYNPLHSSSNPAHRLSMGGGVGFPGPEDLKYHKEQYTSSYSAAGTGTIHHHGYGSLYMSQRPFSVTSPTGFPTHPSPTALNLRSQPQFNAPSPANPPNPNASSMLSSPPKTLDSTEIDRLRKLIIDFYEEEIKKLKSNFREKLQELFFLQNGLNLMDYPQWKRRIPSPQLLAYLNGNRLDEDVIMTTPTATNTISPSTRMSPSYVRGRPETTNMAGVNYTSFPRQIYEQTSANHRVSFQNEFSMTSNYPQLNIGSDSTCPNVSPFTGNVSPRGILTTAGPPFSRSMSLPNAVDGQSLGYMNTRNSSDLLPHVSGNLGTHGQQLVLNGPLNQGGVTRPALVTRTHSLSAVLENSIGSTEEIALEAKKEAEVLKAVGELRKDGLWSERRLPKMQEMTRKKAHWDYLVEEMQWLAADFVQERRWKRGVAKKLSRAVLKYHQEQRSKEMKAEKEESQRLRRIAASIAKEVKHFWVNVEKVVQYKVQSRLEENRKKALDLHLNFIVDQTEKYSSWLVKSLKSQNTSISGSQVSSVASPVSSTAEPGGESDFEASPESDNEETIEMAEREETQEKVDYQKELDLLQQESEISLEELLQSLPPEMLEEQSSCNESDGGSSLEDSGSSDDGSQESEGEDTDVDIEDSEMEPAKNQDLMSKKQVDTEKSETANRKSEVDEEFVITDDLEEDDEQTLEEEEKLAGKEDHDKEIAALEKEGELPIDELLKQYSAAEVDESSDIQSDESVDELSSDEFEEEEEDEEDEMTEFLVKSGDQSGGKKDADSTPDQALTNAAATAESLQPKGFTLETTQIQTKVPFLLRGTLREYQMIGLDWLVTMHEKRLNGILADEMGLGKTIQTISLIAHLACEKGIWGPHLIVVPTSVMLNWEMEFKKWCPGFKVLTYFGNQKERKAKRQGWTKPNAFHVCITSYKLVVQDHQAFRRKKWKYFVLDEAQNIKNFKSQRWQYLLNFNSQRRLLLTGTPLQNSLMELWSLMHFLMPHLFQSHKDFQQWFSNPLTGMIEGSQEYNESIIKRLHKVLRPFLLRRLKLEVEKQMPKKYEHVVRCRLSKRQRYLYDDYMSRAKTKETLESGHFLSVINILMQLRKVCNHPDLFETRPTVSAFQMDGIVYYTASIVLSALDYNPFTCVNMGYLNLSLADIEREVTRLGSMCTMCLQTPKRLILEIDSHPDPAKPFTTHTRHQPFPLLSSSTGQISQVTTKTKAYNSIHSQLQYPSYGHPPPYSQNQEQRSNPYVATVPYSQSNWISNQTSGFGTQSYNGSLLSTPSRLYSSRTDLHSHNYLTRQNSTGFDFSGSHTSYSPSQMSRNLPPPPPYSASHVSLNFRHLSATPGSTHEMQFDLSQTVQDGAAQVDHLHSVTGIKKDSNPKPFAVSPTKKIALDENVGKSIDRKSPFYLPKIVQKQSQQQKDKLARIAAVNSRRCEVQPVYGLDLFAAVSVVDNSRLRNTSQHTCNQTCNFLEELVKFPLQRLDQLGEIINRFVFVVPKAEAPRIQLHASHRAPNQMTRERNLEQTLHRELISKTDCLHPIMSRTKTQFPELRLVQYDCGKLQTLDVLLRKLKSEKHRVLIFTQMTKMLDILERFLNFHGYIYLRLDGTTRVEQRQILMERFNADPRIFIFILSTRSGGLGVNLTGADTVIFYDSDWNPTMDAQAQDRCHRIGQTRDVHIYRLISEMTVEENILKKANQKRLLGDIAIEGGNFTTAFFKEASIKELFKIEETREQSFHRQVGKPQEMKEVPESVETLSGVRESVPESSLFEQALCKAEDEQDALAATMVKAEQAAEIAEFSEGPVDEASEDKQKEEESSRIEEELQALEGELNPVERYAVRFLESSGVYITVDQIKAAEKEVELAKKDWELGHLQALKEEEEKRAAEEEDEILFTYSREDAAQIYVNDLTGEEMPIWTPPTPPREDEDEVYVDSSLLFLYEAAPLTEAHLPELYLTKRYTSGKRTVHKERTYFRHPVQGQAKEKVHRPISVFDRSSLDPLGRNRRASLSKKMKMKPAKQQILQSMVKQPDYSQGAGVPEWLVHEDWALLQAVSYLQELPVDLTANVPSQIPNWDIVSDIVNISSRTYRSAKQCRDRYGNMIIPREEGKIAVPPVEDTLKKLKTRIKPYGVQHYQPHSQMKMKGSKSFKTQQMILSDAGRSPTVQHSAMFELVKKTSQKRKPPLKQMLGDPHMKSLKQTPTSGASGGVSEEKTLNPVQLALQKAERMKAQQQQQLQQQQQQQQQQLQQQQQQQAAQPQQVVQNTKVAQPQPTPTVSKTSQQTTKQFPQQPTSQLAVGVPATQKLATTQLTSTAVTVSSLQKTATIQGTPVTTASTLHKSGLVLGSSGSVPVTGVTHGGSSIVVNTPPGVTGLSSSTFATINKRMQSQGGPSATASLVQVQTTKAIPQRSRQIKTVASAAVTPGRVLPSQAGLTRTTVPASAAATAAQVSTVTASVPATQIARTNVTTAVASASGHTLPVATQQALVQQGVTNTKAFTPQQLVMIRQRQLHQQQHMKRLQQQHQMKRIQVQQHAGGGNAGKVITTATSTTQVMSATPATVTTAATGKTAAVVQQATQQKQQILLQKAALIQQQQGKQQQTITPQQLQQFFSKQKLTPQQTVKLQQIQQQRVQLQFARQKQQKQQQQQQQQQQQTVAGQSTTQAPQQKTIQLPIQSAVTSQAAVTQTVASIQGLQQKVVISGQQIRAATQPLTTAQVTKVVTPSQSLARQTGPQALQQSQVQAQTVQSVVVAQPRQQQQVVTTQMTQIPLQPQVSQVQVQMQQQQQQQHQQHQQSQQQQHQQQQHQQQQHQQQQHQQQQAQQAQQQHQSPYAMRLRNQQKH